MREIWLRSNRRLMWVLMPIPGFLTAIAVIGLAVAWFLDAPAYVWIPAGLISVAGLGYTLVTWRIARLPLLAYERGELLVHYGGVKATRVPIEVVECFFRGTVTIPVRNARGENLKFASVVVRLAERDDQWHNRAMIWQLGTWQDGYISLNGNWSEPITNKLLFEINRRLKEARKDVRSVEKESA